MKKITAFLIAVVCLMFTGCSNSFAVKEYDLDAKIAEERDRYAEIGWKSTSTYNKIHVKAKSFNGRATLVTSRGGDVNISASVSMRLSKGKVKLVIIDSKGNVTALAECSAEDSPLLTETVIPFAIGTNRLKLVGYGCKDVEMQLIENFDSPTVIGE